MPVPESVELSVSSEDSKEAQPRANAKIKEIAQSITVVIWDAQNSLSGTGVIVRRDERIYTVHWQAPLTPSLYCGQRENVGRYCQSDCS